MVYQAIKNYLEDANIQQTVLAEKIGISKQSLHSKLVGDTRISIDEYLDICDALRVDYSFFVSEDRTPVRA